MKRYFAFILLCFLNHWNCYGDRIYILNSPGYNTAEVQLINEISSNGHSVVVNSTTFTLPAGFTSTCLDPINGYDWLCFFGNNNFTGLFTEIQSFINEGGKVFYQYEITCCTQASASIASILSGLTGLPIVPNSEPYIGMPDLSAGPGWYASNVGCCAFFVGAAYKGLDGLPPTNQLLASSTYAFSSPPVSVCPNFGVYFATTDFIGTAHKGAITGIGDYNIWHDGGEPFWNGGTTPINPAIVDFFFPDSSTTCYLFPQGCLETYSNPALTLNLGNDTTLCEGDTLVLDATTANATYFWQDTSTGSTLNVTHEGTYWALVLRDCYATSDTINVFFDLLPEVFLGNDTTLCPGDTLTLDATTHDVAFLWGDGSTNPTLTVTEQDSYWVMLTNDCGPSSDTIIVSYSSLPDINLGNDTCICFGETLVLDATIPEATCQWHDHSTDPIYSVTQQGSYWVLVTHRCGTLSDTIAVETKNCNWALYFPNVFSPNGDGNNDILYVRGNGISSGELFIYNRWGEKVFETNDIAEGWDGSFKGKPLDAGVFNYYLKIRLSDGTQQIKKGNVTLIR
jgi:gliding motility-associated-like protein